MLDLTPWMESKELLASPLLVVFAGPLTELSQQAAAQLYDSASAADIILRQNVSQGDTP